MKELIKTEILKYVTIGKLHKHKNKDTVFVDIKKYLSDFTNRKSIIFSELLKSISDPNLTIIIDQRNFEFFNCFNLYLKENKYPIINFRDIKTYDDYDKKIIIFKDIIVSGKNVLEYLQKYNVVQIICLVNFKDSNHLLNEYNTIITSIF